MNSQKVGNHAGVKIFDLPPRIIEKIRIDKNGCWNWLGGGTGKGHGKVHWEGKWLVAHRVIYKLLVADVEDHLDLDHTCRNRCCVNPHHVEPVTKKENTRRGQACLFRVCKSKDLC
jgi:hypothetical protein